MRVQWLAGVLVAALVATGAGFAVSEAGQDKGRYKKDGNNCFWDANDTGPNQCTPRTAGRFKKNGDACVWDAADRGPARARRAALRRAPAAARAAGRRCPGR